MNSPDCPEAIDKSEKSFKIFESTGASNRFMLSDMDSLSSSIASLSLASSAGKSNPEPRMPWQQNPSPGGDNFTTFRAPPTPETSSVLTFPSDRSQKRRYSGHPHRPKRLYICNLPFRYREHNLVMLFGKFGNVEEAEIIFNGKGSKGFGFVTMSRGQDADNALSMLNNAIVEGRVLEVNVALPKRPKKSAAGSSAPAGAAYTHRAPTPLALAEAEAELAEAELEVLRIRRELENKFFPLPFRSTI